MKQERVDARRKRRFFGLTIFQIIIYAALLVIGLGLISYGGLMLDRMQAQQLTTASQAG